MDAFAYLSSEVSLKIKQDNAGASILETVRLYARVNSGHTVTGLKQMHGGQLPAPGAPARHSSLLHSGVYFLVNAKCMWQDPDPKSLQWIDCVLRA